ncbi:MAG: PEP-CTERM sorting domain-containing protein, partial [Planctomycetia bacterium]|nr:PEP-CTERM sorting domain-containing protein [Planctomycetia bacterium]
YFDGRTTEGTQGEFAFTNTNTTYTGYIDGYSWPLATANIGTAAVPLKLAPSGVSTSPAAEYRLAKLDIGTEGNTGYVVLSSGIIRTSQTENRGIYLGDTHQDSDGTLVLTGTGKLAGHYSSGNAGNLFVGAASGGKGRLILAGGTLASESGGSGKINVTVNATGTVEIASGSYTWGGLQLKSDTTFAGNLEITGGTLNAQGNKVTLNALNSGSQYKASDAVGTLNNTGATATATLNNTAAGVYDGYAITGNWNVVFGAEGQTGRVQSVDGTITSTGKITILSDTTFENMTIFGNDLTINTDAALSILFDPSSYDPNASVLMDFGDIGGTLQISFTEPWTQAYGWDFDLFTANNLPEMILPYGFHGSIIDGMVTITGDPAALPEPSTWCLMILGFLGMVWMRRKK